MFNLIIPGVIFGAVFYLLNEKESSNDEAIDSVCPSDDRSASDCESCTATKKHRRIVTKKVKENVKRIDTKKPEETSDVEPSISSGDMVKE